MSANCSDSESLDLSPPHSVAGDIDAQLHSGKASAWTYAPRHWDLRVTVLPADSDGAAPFQLIRLAEQAEKSGSIPTPQQLTDAVKDSQWILRPGKFKGFLYAVLRAWTSIGQFWLRKVKEFGILMM